MRTKISGSAKVIDLNLNRVCEPVRYRGLFGSAPVPNEQRFKGNLIVEIDVTSMEVGSNGLEDFMRDCEREINNLVGNELPGQRSSVVQHYEGRIKQLYTQMDTVITARDNSAKEVTRLKRQLENQAATIAALQKDVATAQGEAKTAQAVVDALADAQRSVVHNSTHYKVYMSRSRSLANRIS